VVRTERGRAQPIINEGLVTLIHSLDGTRYYSPSSNEVNLQGSGPYSYQDPADYFTKLNAGFSVETGTPSLPTREWFERWLPEADRWPLSDDWAYHDWHQAGNGDVNSFDQHMEAPFGAATNLDDYVRKAQMMSYVDHRAIFEGMNAHLWSPNSGRMLWMTQPAWPSTMGDLHVRLGYAGFLLWNQEGMRARARAARSLKRHRASCEYYNRSAPWIEDDRARVQPGQPAPAEQGRSDERRC